jgi:hypothetical protein
VAPSVTGHPPQPRPVLTVCCAQTATYTRLILRQPGSSFAVRYCVQVAESDKRDLNTTGGIRGPTRHGGAVAARTCGIPLAASKQPLLRERSPSVAPGDAVQAVGRRQETPGTFRMVCIKRSYSYTCVEDSSSCQRRPPQAADLHDVTTPNTRKQRLTPFRLTPLMQYDVCSRPPQAWGLPPG